MHAGRVTAKEKWEAGEASLPVSCLHHPTGASKLSGQNTSFIF